MSIAISGISNNSMYYTGNDIWVMIYETNPVERILIQSLTVQFQGVPGEYVFYPNPSYDFWINLSPIAKLVFDKPAHDPNYSNLNAYIATTNFQSKTVTFVVKKVYGTQSIVRTSKWVRGYRRTNGTNIAANYDQYLTNSDKIPVWAGYPSAGYIIFSPDSLSLGSPVGIYKQINIPNSSKEVLREKNCTGKYIKFMNSLGGYSTWLFEKREYKTSNTHLGYAATRQGYSDFGSYGENEHNLQSKVPTRYMGLIRDLIESPEVYIYNPTATIADDLWQRIILQDNSITENTWDGLYTVEIKAEAPLKYNPSLIW